MTLRDRIEAARRAQQENEQKHDVQLEIVATAGPRCPHCGWIHETADDADTGRRSNYRCEHCARLFSRSTPLHQVCVIPQQELRSADYLEWQYRQNEIHGPGPDCDGED